MRLTLHSERFNTEEIRARKEKEKKKNGLGYVVDGVALVIRKKHM